MTGKATSLDVAELAGVSRSAVSRVFTPGASVSKKTADKVRAAAEELGYRPNVLARGLLTGRSRMIGLVVAYLDNHFYPTVLERLSNALQEQGYHVLVFMASKQNENLDAVATEILDYQVDALILASVEISSDIARRCRATGVPVILFNRRQGAPGELAVVSDNFEGGRLAARHLFEAGCRRIAHIAGNEDASTQRDREAGFLQGLGEVGLTLASREVGGFVPERASEAARTMFAGSNTPDGIFVANDYMAFSVLDTLRCELGLSVPEDVAVVGFDDVPSASWRSFDLTTVRQDSADMVARTVDLVLDATSGVTAEPVGLVPVELVVRSTTARSS